MASSGGSTGYSVASGIALVTRLAETGQFIFTTEQARRVARDLGVLESGVTGTLSRLADARWIVRLRRGLYAGTGRLPGGVDVHPFAIATALVSPSAVSHWSALAYHGLTTQVPLIVTVTSPKKVVTPSMRNPVQVHDRRPGKHLWKVAGIEIEFVKVRPDRYFGATEVWVDQQCRVPVMDLERTVLDLFATPRRFGGLDQGLATLQEYWPRLDLTRLVEYSLRFGSKAVSARLGWALERAGASHEALDVLRAHVGPGLQILDPTRVARGRRDSRWFVLDNVTQPGQEL